MFSISMIIGTVLAVIAAMLLLTGGKYDEVVESIEKDEFPFKTIYCIGYKLSNIFKMPENIYVNLIREAKLVYDPKYSEFFVNLIWAQLLSFVYVSVTVGFVCAGIFGMPLYAILGVVMSMVLGQYCYKSMGKNLSERELECTIELPEVVSTLALLINSGMVLKEAWEIIAFSKEGKIYSLMQEACSHMQNGMSDREAISKFGKMSNSTEIKKFTSMLEQGIEKGNSELGASLVAQSGELWNVKRQYMLQKGEAAATKLVAPTGIIFIGIIILVIAGAAGMLA